ncbi:hypothetical protein SGB_04627 [Shigella boydii ATCC 9905]|nr:hypothetical protein SGB_04627 [Shigella boydii ATCC 9905]
MHDVYLYFQDTHCMKSWHTCQTTWQVQAIPFTSVLIM